MSTSPLSPQEIRAAAETHEELGPEYSDAVIESFLERVDREITARVDARSGTVSRERPARPVQSDSRRTLLTGVAIGILITAGPLLAVITKSNLVVLIGIPLLWAIAAAIAVRHSRGLRRREPGRSH
jgi:hypothetical protein